MLTQTTTGVRFVIVAQFAKWSLQMWVVCRSSLTVFESFYSTVLIENAKNRWRSIFMLKLQHSRSLELYWEYLTHGENKESEWIKMCRQFRESQHHDGEEKVIMSFKKEKNLDEAIVQLK